MRQLLRQILVIGHRRDMLEEAALIVRLVGEIEGETGLRPLEPAMDIAVPHRRIAPFVDIDIGLGEERVFGGGGRGAARLGVGAGPCRCDQGQ